MKTILVKFYEPNEVMDVTPETTPEEIKAWCFRVNHYEQEGECLWDYANTQVLWSTILDENDDYHKFVDEAWEHIQKRDYDWLEEHFV